MQAEKYLKWSEVQNDDRIALLLSGELSRDTLLPLWKAWRERTFLSEKQIADKHLLWDLAQVKRVDSAGFALLCNLLEYCRQTQQQNKTLRLENVPPQVVTLADLFGLTERINSLIK